MMIDKILPNIQAFKIEGDVSLEIIDRISIKTSGRETINYENEHKKYCDIIENRQILKWLL